MEQAMRREDDIFIPEIVITLIHISLQDPHP